MINQRKRVAKRLASGLMAGALAIGGLAVTGGSGVFAKTPTSPTTNRYGGADRYETAVSLARDFANVGQNGLIIASGESPYDALAAGTLGGVKDAPIVLVKKDSLPTSVADLLADAKSELKASSAKVYVVGGTSAISEAVVDAIKAIVHAGDATPIQFVRIAGATRYETARQIADIAGVTQSTDRMILVNGDNDRWADALSVGALAAIKGWPIVLTSNGGLNDTAKAAIDDYLDIPGSDELFLIVGGSTVMPSSVEDYLTQELEIPLANIDRRGGADRYATNLLLNQYGLADLGFGSCVTLVSGTRPWDALTAAPWAGSCHIVTVPDSGLGTSAGTLAPLLSAGLQNADDLYIVGGTAAVTNAQKDAFLAAASGATDGAFAIDESDCVEGRIKVDFSSNKQLVQDTADDNPSLTDENGAMVADGNEEYFFAIDDDELADADVSIARTTTGEVFPSQSNTNYTVTVAATAAFEVDQVITLADITEGDEWDGGFDWERSMTGDECVVIEDDEAPEVDFTITTTENDAADALVVTQITLSSNEPITLTDFACGDDIEDGAGNDLFTAGCATTAVNEIAYGTIGGDVYANKWILRPAAADVATAGTGVEFDEDDALIFNVTDGDIRDLAGNDALMDDGSIPAADEDAPVAEISASLCLDQYTTSGVGGTYGGAASGTPVAASASVGGLTVTAAQRVSGFDVYGFAFGASANQWDLEVVYSRNLNTPTIAIDSTSKSVTVTADINYHTADDIVTLAGNLGIQGVQFTFTSTGTGALDEDDADFENGTKLCFALVVFDEPVTADTTGVGAAAVVDDLTLTVDNAAINLGPMQVVQLCGALVVSDTMICDTFAVIFETVETGDAELVSLADGTNGFEDVNGNSDDIELEFSA